VSGGSEGNANCVVWRRDAKCGDRGVEVGHH